MDKVNSSDNKSLNYNQFKNKKSTRILTYTIIIGFAFLMFLPTSISLPEIFSGNLLGNYFSVNGFEVFDKVNPVYGKSIKELLKETIDEKNLFQSAYLISQVIQNWNIPSTISKIEMIRQQIFAIVLWNMTLMFAKDQGYDISDEDFEDFIYVSYKMQLDSLYNSYKEKSKDRGNFLNKSDWLDDNKDYYWDGFYNWALVNLKDQYIHNMLARPLYLTFNPIMQEIERDFVIDNEMVKVDFALYSYDDFLKEKILLSNINKGKLRNYYNSKNSNIDVKKLTFKTKQDALNAKSEDGIFSDSEGKENKYSPVSVSISSDDDIYSILNGYNENEISSVIESKLDKGIFELYKILRKPVKFDNIDVNSDEYSVFVTDYARNSYKDFEKDYESHARRVLSSFLDKSRKLGFFKQTNAGFLQYLNVGTTDFFTHNAMSIKDESMNSDKLSSDNFIKEFVEYDFRTSKKYINDKFFKEAFSLENNAMSDNVISSNFKYLGSDRKIFFVLHKIDYKKPDFSDLEDKDTLLSYKKQISRSNVQLINRFLVKYLLEKKSYSVDVNIPKILKSFNLTSLNINDKAK